MSRRRPKSSIDPNLLPRAEAVLKNLPEARQDALYEYLTVARVPQTLKRVEKEGAKGAESTHTTNLRRPTQVEAVAWLAKDGIITSTRALSEWIPFYLARRHRASEAAAARESVKEMKEQGWLKTAEEERAAAQIIFTRMAIHDENVKAWSLSERLAVAKDKVQLERERIQEHRKDRALEREKFEFAASEACLKHLPKLRQIAGSKSMDQNQQINAVRAALFGELPA